YNTGYPTACSYLFHGALIGAEPMLDHHPEIQAKIRKGLSEAQRIKNMDRRAWAMRDVILDVRKDLRPKMLADLPDPSAPTLWGRLGGEKGVTKIIDDCISGATADPKVDFFRSGKFKMTPAQLTELKKKIVLLVSAASGGPYKYLGKSMK